MATAPSPRALSEAETASTDMFDSGTGLSMPSTNRSRMAFRNLARLHGINRGGSVDKLFGGCVSILGESSGLNIVYAGIASNDSGSLQRSIDGITEVFSLYM